MLSPWNESAMSGKAMLTIVASTNAMKTPSDATSSTVRAEGARRRAGSRAGTGAGVEGGAVSWGEGVVVAVTQRTIATGAFGDVATMLRSGASGSISPSKRGDCP